MNLADSLNELAAMLLGMRQFEQAEAATRQALASDPRHAGAWANLGAALHLRHAHSAAVDACRHAIGINANHGDAHIVLGMSLHELRRHDEAIAALRLATELNPHSADAWLYLGETLSEQKHYAEAVAAYRKALQLNPKAAYLPGQFLHLKMRLCEWTEFDGELAQLQQAIAAGAKACKPFQLLGLIDSPALQRQAAAIWAEEIPRPHAAHTFASRHADKIRLAYFSADLHEHATAYLMAGLFEAHDKERFELYAFSFGPITDDAMQQRVKSAFDHFIDVRRMEDHEIASLARELGIDIAIDLKGYTGAARPGIFAQRAAPVQVNYLGYPGSMATDFIDYLITDAVVIPPEAEVHYAEKILRLPHCYQANDRLRPIADKVYTRRECGLPEQGFIFCCFNNAWKITPDVFAGWMRILAQVEGSLLWLYEENAEASANLRRTAAAQGIDAARLIFARQLPLAEHLARLRLADLCLDTLPYNAHTTASDALWAGVPLLTCIGKSFPARVAASLLHAIGLPELVTETPQDYVKLAIELARNPAHLSALRSKLAGNRLSQPLFDTELFTRHIEATCRSLFERHCADLSPTHLQVENHVGYSE